MSDRRTEEKIKPSSTAIDEVKKIKNDFPEKLISLIAQSGNIIKSDQLKQISDIVFLFSAKLSEQEQQLLLTMIQEGSVKDPEQLAVHTKLIMMAEKYFQNSNKNFLRLLEKSKKSSTSGPVPDLKEKPSVVDRELKLARPQPHSAQKIDDKNLPVSKKHTIQQQFDKLEELFLELDNRAYSLQKSLQITSDKADEKNSDVQWKDPFIGFEMEQLKEELLEITSDIDSLAIEVQGFSDETSSLRDFHEHRMIRANKNY